VQLRPISLADFQAALKQVTPSTQHDSASMSELRRCGRPPRHAVREAQHRLLPHGSLSHSLRPFGPPLQPLPTATHSLPASPQVERPVRRGRQPLQGGPGILHLTTRAASRRRAGSWTLLLLAGIKTCLPASPLNPWTRGCLVGWRSRHRTCCPGDCSVPPSDS
jgi:hypothetical protein